MKAKDAREFLEEKGIEITTVVSYHYTGDPEDGITIDLELLMNEFRDDILKASEGNTQPDTESK